MAKTRDIIKNMIGQLQNVVGKLEDDEEYIFNIWTRGPSFPYKTYEILGLGSDHLTVNLYNPPSNEKWVSILYDEIVSIELIKIKYEKEEVKEESNDDNS